MEDGEGFAVHPLIQFGNGGFSRGWQYERETSGRMKRVKDWTKQRGNVSFSNGNMPILNLVLSRKGLNSVME